MEISTEGWDWVRREILVRQEPAEAPSNITYGFWLGTLQTTGHSDHEASILSRSQHCSLDRVHIAPGFRHTAGVVCIVPKKTPWNDPLQIRWMKFGFDEDFRPVCLIAEWTGDCGGCSETSFAAAANSKSGSPAHDAVFAKDWIKGQVEKHELNPFGWEGPINTARVSTFNAYSNSLRPQKAELTDMNVRIDMSLLPDYSPPPTQLEGQFLLPPAIASPQIWTVDITVLKQYPPIWESCLC